MKSHPPPRTRSLVPSTVRADDDTELDAAFAIGALPNKIVSAPETGGSESPTVTAILDNVINKKAIRKLSDISAVMANVNGEAIVPVIGIAAAAATMEDGVEAVVRIAIRGDGVAEFETFAIDAVPNKSISLSIEG